MPKNDLIDAISLEMNRVWGEDGLHGEPEEYAWLEEHYGVTEEDDVCWQLTIQHHFGDLPKEDQDDAEVMQFLNDDARVEQFLRDLLRRYQANTLTYHP